MLENRKDWGDKVRIIAMSIDKNVESVKTQVDTYKWTSVEHYHANNGVSTVGKSFGVVEIFGQPKPLLPKVFIVDTSGTVVYAGNSKVRNLEEDIDLLLEGEKIDGEEARKEQEIEAKGKEMSDEVYKSMTEEF